MLHEYLSSAVSTQPIIKKQRVIATVDLDVCLVLSFLITTPFSFFSPNHFIAMPCLMNTAFLV